MISEAKVVQLGATVYLVSGLLILFESGVFVPTIPLSGFFIGLFALIIGALNYKQDKKLYLYLLLYGVSSVLFSNLILETSLPEEELIKFKTEVFPFVKAGQLILLFILFFYLIIQRINEKIQFSVLPLLTVITATVLSLLGLENIVRLLLGLFGILLFFQIRKEGEPGERLNIYGLKYFFVGLGFIKIMDFVAFLF